MPPGRKLAKKDCCLTQIELTRDAERDLIDIYLFSIEHFGQPRLKHYAAAHLFRGQLIDGTARGTATLYLVINAFCLVQPRHQELIFPECR